jgi:hypothetical protein
MKQSYEAVSIARPPIFCLSYSGFRGLKFSPQTSIRQDQINTWSSNVCQINAAYVIYLELCTVFKKFSLNAESKIYSASG